MMLLVMMTYPGAFVGGLVAYAATGSLVATVAGVFAGSTAAVLAGAALLHRGRAPVAGPSCALRPAQTNR